VLGLLLAGIIIYGIFSILQSGSQQAIGGIVLTSGLPFALVIALLAFFYFWPSTLIRIGRTDLAIAHYSNIIRLRPKSYMDYSHRGALQFQLKNTSAALSDYDQAVMLSNQHPFILMQRGVLKIMLADYPAALADLNASLLRVDTYKNPQTTGTGITETLQIKNPDMLRAIIYYNRGVAHYFLGDFEAARTELQFESQSTPETAATVANLAVLRHLFLALIDAREDDPGAARNEWVAAQQASKTGLDFDALLNQFILEPLMKAEFEQVLRPIIVSETIL
jgi:tetratricopeptide (TPR) repeat protein